MTRIKNFLTLVRHETTGEWPIVAAAVLSIVVFVLDISVPSGVATQILYVAPILVSLWSRKPGHTLVFANICTGCTVVGFYLTTPGTFLWVDVANRLLALYAIWATTLISLLRKQSEEATQKSHDAMERSLKKQATELTQANEELRKEIGDRRRAEESLRKLSGYLLHLQDDERRRIARELHDTSGQTLAAIAVNLSRLEKLSTARDPKMYDVLADSMVLVEECSREIRTLSYLLHPPLLEEAGLASAVRWYCDGFSQRSRIKVDVEVPPLERFNSDLETTLFRILQESLTNISRHSNSPTAKIRIVRGPGEIMLEVADQGRGIPPEKMAKVNGNVAGLGVGMAGIWERVRQFEGDLDINSSNRGTTVTVVLPIPEETQ